MTTWPDAHILLGSMMDIIEMNSDGETTWRISTTSSQQKYLHLLEMAGVTLLLEPGIVSRGEEPIVTVGSTRLIGIISHELSTFSYEPGSGMPIDKSQ